MVELTGKQRMALRNLLGAIILADGRVKDEEVNAYARKVCELTGGRFEVARESEWLLEQVPDLRQRMQSRSARHWLAEQISILNSVHSITDLLDAIWTVAVSDSDLHPNEADILDYAFARWIGQS